jgi:hypothetical protein
MCLWRGPFQTHRVLLNIGRKTQAWRKKRALSASNGVAEKCGRSLVRREARLRHERLPPAPPRPDEGPTAHLNLIRKPHLSTPNTTKSLAFRPLNFPEPSPPRGRDTAVAVNRACAGTNSGAAHTRARASSERKLGFLKGLHKH